jgi:hypothetical protein
MKYFFIVILLPSILKHSSTLYIPPIPRISNTFLKLVVLHITSFLYYQLLYRTLHLVRP